jgi:hypothetical protein
MASGPSSGSAPFSWRLQAAFIGRKPAGQRDGQQPKASRLATVLDLLSGKTALSMAPEARD